MKTGWITTKRIEAPIPPVVVVEDSSRSVSKAISNSKWLDWLEGLEVKLLDNGEMILSGTLVDQTALMGVLNKLNRLNLTLLSGSQVNPSDLNKHSREAKWKTHEH